MKNIKNLGIILSVEEYNLQGSDWSWFQIFRCYKQKPSSGNTELFGRDWKTKQSTVFAPNI